MSIFTQNLIQIRWWCLKNQKTKRVVIFSVKLEEVDEVMYIHGEMTVVIFL